MDQKEARRAWVSSARRAVAGASGVVSGSGVGEVDIVSRELF